MRPQLWVIAGPNGAGKSTLANRHVRDRLPLVNPDNILASDPGLSPVGAGKRAIEQMQELLTDKRAFAWETTLSGNRELLIMQQAKEQGYKVNLVFVGIRNPGTSFLRVADRVAAGGHNVPPADVVRRYERSLVNLPKALQIADRAFVFDNSGERRRLLVAIEQGKVRNLSKSPPRWFLDAVPRDLRREQGVER